MKKLMENFRSPGAEFRGAPFWAWNAKLDKNELIRQINVFKKMGLGGFFMHSRVGLATQYLGEEWFECIKTCINEAKKLGLNANIYDEDRWPSGTAGSLAVPNDDFKHRYCSLEIYSCALDAEKISDGKILAWFSAKVSGSLEKKDLSVTAPERLSSPADFKPARGRKLLRFAEYLAESSSWFNGSAYLDTMNPNAVKNFVNLTHEAYYREIGEEFGGAVKMIFTDEPNFRSWFNTSELCLPWTASLPELFQNKYGFDLLDHLPELFFASVKKLSGARMKYFNLITELFVESYFGTLGEWCGKHNIDLTGHLFFEDRLIQSVFTGAAMRPYEYMQIPGIDQLTEHRRIFNTVKQCSSMAHQFGRKRRVSEIYGCTGWDFPFAGHKAQGDWQYALGINARCQHLAWYSAEAEAKRDYPASISYQSPWHEQYHAVEDYFGRLGAVLSEGEEICDLLVIHPIESAWLKISAADISGSLAQEEKQFVDVTDAMLSQKLDFDFGDEEIISRYGTIKDHKLIINKAAYKAVLIPRLLTIRSSTLALLEKFADHGGTVVYLNSAPAFLDGEPSGCPAEVFAKFSKTTLRKAADLLKNSVRRVSVSGRDGLQIKPVLARLSDCGKAFTLFLCNYGANFTSASAVSERLVRDRKLKFPLAKIEVKVPQRGKVYELDLRNGSVQETEFTYQDDRYIFSTSFDELESHLYLITAEDPGETVKAPAIQNFKPAHRLPANNWDFKLSEPNILVLDHADCRADGKTVGNSEYILKLDDKLRESLGAPPRGGLMMQPWFKEKQPPAKTIELELAYHIQINDIPKSDCMLAVEHPEFYSFELNGKTLNNDVKSWWCDRIIQCITVPASLLKHGANTLVLRSKYHENLPGLEAVFLLGDFGVSADDKLISLPEKLSIGDWCSQGLRFYAGNVTYSKEVEISSGGARMDFGQWRGISLGIQIDDGQEIMLPWPPYQMPLPGGKHRINIKVYGSRRNALGPFYCKTACPPWTGPTQFKALESEIRQLVPCGLLQPPNIREIREI